MQDHVIDYPEAYQEFKKYVKEHKYDITQYETFNNGYKLQFEDHESFFIPKAPWPEEISKDILSWTNREEKIVNRLVFGKDQTKNIVSCEINDNQIELFIEDTTGVRSEWISNQFWLLSSRQFDSNWHPLDGNQHYRFIKYYSSPKQYYSDRKRYKDYVYGVSDPKESAMILNGFTYFKGMKVDEVSTLSFDIETTGLNHDETSKVLLISNTFRKNGVITRKLFAYDEYNNSAEFLDTWCDWVREVNPSVMLGHNIFIYDLPYMIYCADQAGTSLCLGRDESDIKVNNYTSKFRFDGSQDYDYKRCNIYGREIVDTWFIAMKYDIGRKYSSYRLKSIIADEGLEVAGRQFYDAATIKDNYINLEEWKKIKTYSVHDADDALALYDLMVPAFFYVAENIPKSFQTICYSASGSQLNALLVRGYLQDNHSIPKANESFYVEGGISFGVPGLHKNVLKIDLRSAYPSQILRFKLYDKNKDPKQYFYKMTKFFTYQRFELKKLAKEEKGSYYKDRDKSAKLLINSVYGLCNTNGLNFNSPTLAAIITKETRNLIDLSLMWASGTDHTHWMKKDES